MRFNVTVSHITAEAVLNPHDSSVNPITLGSGQGDMLPIFPDYFGQLVGIISFPFRHGDDVCGSGFGGMEEKYVIAPFRPLRARYCGLARLADDWTGEPVVAQLHSLIESGEKAAVSPGSTLSQVLYTLFRATWSERIVLCFGTQDILMALQSVDGQLTVSGPPLDRLMRAIIELRVSPRELDTHWPGATHWVTLAFQAHASQQADCMARLRRARQALEHAVETLAAAQAGHDASAQAFAVLQTHYDAWRADSASAPAKVPASE